MAFHTLVNLEPAENNLAAAEAARNQAIDAYLAYRRDGGEPQSITRTCPTHTPSKSSSPSASIAAPNPFTTIFTNQINNIHQFPLPAMLR